MAARIRTRLMDLLNLRGIERTAPLVAVVDDTVARSVIEERAVRVAVYTRRIEFQLRLVLVEHSVLARRNRYRAACVVVRAVTAELKDETVDFILDGILRVHDIALAGCGPDGACTALVLECAAPRLDNNIRCARADNLPARRNRDAAAVPVCDIDRRVCARNFPRNGRATLRLNCHTCGRRDVAEGLDLVRTCEVHGVRLYLKCRNGLQNACRGYIPIRLDRDDISKALGQIDAADLDAARILTADANPLESRPICILLQQSRAAENVGRQCRI